MSADLTFDAAPSAKPLFKERLLWTLVMGLFFFLVYGSANQIAALTAPHPSFFWDWERSIPFIPEFVIPYFSSDLVFVIAFAIAPTREAIQKFAIRCGLAVVISAAFFLLMPLEFSFTRPEVSGWPKAWFDALSLDQPYNQFPSLHISLGFMAWYVIRNCAQGVLRWLVTAWFFLIAASTLLVYQHHAIDLVGGAAMVRFIFWLVPEKGAPRLPLVFVTPRHLHMAFRYMVLAAISALCAFNAGIWAVLFGWIALSMLGVSAGYTLGLNGFLLKGGRHHSWLSWLVFWPYLVGSWLNWRYWRAKVPLMAAVQPGLWIGARPAGGDWPALSEAGVNSVIDLAPELAATTPNNIEHHHIPLLDIAIPAPSALDAIARSIESHLEKGGVYVHCALGMSRSVLAVAAWMVRHGQSFEEALAVLDQVRPERVRKPYMAISLKLYEEYLAAQSPSAGEPMA